MDTILIIIFSALAGITAGVLVSISLIRKAIIKKNATLILDAEEKGEMIKKDKILQAKEKFIQLKSDH
jgi:ribonuclease Y